MTNKAEIETDELEPDLELGETPASAAATANGGVPKNFRQQADMEAFYRFVHENDLRDEALTILDNIRVLKNAEKSSKRVKH